MSDETDSRSSMCGFSVCFFLSTESMSSEKHKTNVLALIYPQWDDVYFNIEPEEHLLRGSPSVLLRLCWDNKLSLGLPGLFLTRFSELLQ